MAQLDYLLKALLETNGSSLHLVSGEPAKVRIHGKLISLTKELVSDDYLTTMLQEICPFERWQYFLTHKDLDFAYDMENMIRFGVNYSHNYCGKAAVFRVIPSQVLSMEKLNLPEILKNICEYNGGLICITGPAGNGKTATMAAMIDYINSNSVRHIVTIEDPIEFVHKNKRSIIMHREIGIHAKSFPEALKGVMRSNADVVLLSEMRDVETIKLALNCAAMGMLVFTTLRTTGAVKTIDRIIDLFPMDEQPMVRSMIAESLRAVVSQLLCIKADGSENRIPVHEILLWTDALPHTIRSGVTSNVKVIIDSNVSKGMCSMDSELKKLLDARIITPKEAYMNASNKKDFLKYLSSKEVNE